MSGAAIGTSGKLAPNDQRLVCNARARHTCIRRRGRRCQTPRKQSVPFALTLAGLISLAIKGGPLLSIDFKGGAVMDVRWHEAPPVPQIRSALSTTLRDISIVEAHDSAGSNDLLISSSITTVEDLTSL